MSDVEKTVKKILNTIVYIEREICSYLDDPLLELEFRAGFVKHMYIGLSDFDEEFYKNIEAFADKLQAFAKEAREKLKNICKEVTTEKAEELAKKLKAIMEQKVRQ